MTRPWFSGLVEGAEGGGDVLWEHGGTIISVVAVTSGARPRNRPSQSHRIHVDLERR
jgi:hypothetical protein